ncbi:MAG: hypothetical protein GXY23_09390 [Myxococcales bacterium]|jgi:hypothetical protein|nr:hypothetical protein [Myxococcales bacterium]
MSKQNRWLAALAMAGVVGMTGVLSSGALARDHDKVELTGPVKNLKGSCPNVEFEIAGTKVKTSSRTDFEDDCREIAEGKRVEVEGKLEGDRIMAKEVDVK